MLVSIIQIGDNEYILKLDDEWIAIGNLIFVSKLADIVRR